jgi:hypothetical protein
MEDKIDKNLYTEAMRAALKVEFLDSKEEVKLYAASLYNAMIWGKTVTTTKRQPSPKQQAV